MRRRAYPYGRYLISSGNLNDLGPKMKTIIEEIGFPIIKYDTKNEDIGTLIIGVNKKVLEILKEPKPSGRLEMLISGFGLDVPSFRETVRSGDYPNGGEVVVRVTVRENAGRYTGNTATWAFYFSVAP